MDAPFELVNYPKAGQDFILEGFHHDAEASAGAWARTPGMLKKYLN